MKHGPPVTFGSAVEGPRLVVAKAKSPAAGPARPAPPARSCSRCTRLHWDPAGDPVCARCCMMAMRPEFPWVPQLVRKDSAVADELTREAQAMGLGYGGEL